MRSTKKMGNIRMKNAPTNHPIKKVKTKVIIIKILIP